MEVVRIKYDNFKKYVDEIVKPEHFDKIGSLMKLRAEDIIVLVKDGPPTVEECQEEILNEIGFDESIINEYPVADVVKMKRYLEYFFMISQTI